MRRLITYIFILVLLTSLTAAQTNINNKFIKGQNITIDEPSTDNLYVAGSNIEVLKNVNGDLLVAASNVEIAGNVFDDILIASGNVVVKGDIGGDARIAAGNVKINSAIFKDLVAFAGTVELSESSIVGRDVLIRAGNTIINGVINGDVDVSGSSITINGIISGDLKTDSTAIVLGDDALIKGKLIVPRSVNLDETKVKGGIEVSPESFIKIKPKSPGFWPWVSFFIFIVLIGLVMLFIARNYTEKATHNIIKTPVSSFFIGLLVLIFTPVVVVLMTITLIGIPLALILLLIYGLLVILGLIVSAMMVGKLLYSLFDTETPPFKGLFVGALGFIILLLIPILGVLAFMYLESTAIGGLVRASWQKPLRKRRKK